MKKIKGILLFGIGILSTLFSTCFGVSSQSYRVIKDVSSESFNGIFGLANNDGNGSHFYVLSGLNSLSFSFNSRSNSSTSNINASNVYFDYGSLGFRIRGYGSSSGNIIFNNGFDSLKYTVDSIPSCLIYDSNVGGYLSFGGLTLDGVYSNKILFNGEVIYSFPGGGIYRCIYGVGNSFSVLHSSGSSSSGYNYDFYNIYFDSDGNYHIDSGYSVIPIYNSGNDLSGSGVYIISFDSTSSNLIFNYYDVFSSIPGIIKQGNLINKGFSYTSLIPYDFIYGTFLSYSTVSYSSVSNLYFSYFCYLPNGEDMKCYTPLSDAQLNNSYYIPLSDIQFPIYRQGVFSLTSDSSAPVIDLPSDGGQSSGSMAINTGLINLCLTSPSFYDMNTIFCNRVFGGRDLSYIQGLISSGAYLQSYIDGSGNLVYVVDITDEPGVLTGSVSWDCYGDRCINTQSGSWGDVEPWEILHLSGGDILSSGYYLGFFESINETGYFFKCPYSYNNSRWIAGKSILNAIGRDPFLPINCFIAAYENGRRVKLFDEAFNGYSRGPLMSGDTQNHKNLFTFFDILLSVALIFFLMKFYHLFK